MIATSRIIALFAAFPLLAACGLKGPLYLPKDAPETAPPPTTSAKPKKTAPPAAPAPAPTPSAQ